MTELDGLTEAEKDELKNLLGSPTGTGDTKHNVHTFLHNVVTAKDTTKLGVLTNTELGNMPNPVRAFKHLASFADSIMKKPGLSKYFDAQSEIGTATSLSRNGTLVKLAVIQHKKIEDVTKEPRENKGWFKRKDDDKDNQIQE